MVVVVVVGWGNGGGGGVCGVKGVAGKRKEAGGTPVAKVSRYGRVPNSRFCDRSVLLSLAVHFDPRATRTQSGARLGKPGPTDYTQPFPQAGTSVRHAWRAFFPKK